MTDKSIRIGNGAGFWGDNLDAPRQLAEHGDLDYLTLEYLAELTLSILAHQRSKEPAAGFVTDVATSVAAILPALSGTKPLKVVTNGGGMNPSGCAQATSRVLVEAGLADIRVAAVAGDDLMPRLEEFVQSGELFRNFDDPAGKPLGELFDRVASANVYLGAGGIVQALEAGAQIVLTGRVADAALVVGPAVYEFGWAWDDWTRLGAATVAGHLIECGAQVTGGMYSDWTPEMDLSNVGYPIAELSADGTCIISKPPRTGGQVSVGTVSEQLVYEIGNPTRYLTPDVIANFAHVTLEQLADERVRVTGGDGIAAPATLKVSLAYYDGFTTSGTIVVSGPNAIEKARHCVKAIEARMRTAGYELAGFEYECLGAGDTLPGMSLWRVDVAGGRTSSCGPRSPSGGD